jgi:hypothetical protein
MKEQLVVNLGPRSSKLHSDDLAAIKVLPSAYDSLRMAVQV